MLTASGCSAFGQELEPFVDLTALGAVVTKSVQLRAALRPADPAHGRDAERDAQLDRPAGAGDRRAARRGPALAGRARRAGVRLHRRHPGRGLRRARRAAARRARACWASRSTSAARTWRAAARCSPATRSPPPTSIGAVRAAADPAQPVYAKLSPDVTDIVSRRPRGRRRRRRRAVDDQHAARPGDRPRHDAAGPGRGDRRAVRPGDPPGGAALRLAGARRACRRCRSSGWAASAAAWTPCSSSSPARRRVSVGTAVFNDPSAPARIHAELAAALAARGFASLTEAVGYAHRRGRDER